MDLAPALPPTQGNVSFTVATAAGTPPKTAVGTPLSSSLTSSPILMSQSLQTPLATVPPAQIQVPVALTAKFSTIAAARPSGFLSSLQLTRSFNFIGQAFQAAKLSSQISNAIGRPQYSANVPIQWARSNDWKSWAATAEIEVALVDANAQVATIENNAWAAVIAPQCMPNAARDLKEAPRYRITLRNKTLGYVADEDRAYLLAQQLKRLIRQGLFEREVVAPYPAKGISTKGRTDHNDWIVGTPQQPLFSIDTSMAEAVGYSKEWAAVAWANNLRLALEAEPLSTGEAQMTLKNMEPSELSIEGDASWYGPYFHGRATANGETYNQHDLTVAHKSLPFGTHLKVRNTLNDKTVVVRVNDRGPYVGDRSLDLSRAAADCLGSDDVGVVPYEAVVLKTVKAK
ncbi:MAG: septal ring lytic transglycosylase RlpA family protein [Cyanobacteria bacterium P01_A01_bin.116]